MVFHPFPGNVEKSAAYIPSLPENKRPCQKIRSAGSCIFYSMLRYFQRTFRNFPPFSGVGSRSLRNLFAEDEGAGIAARKMEGAGLFVLAAQLLDGAPGCGQLFFAGSALHGKEVSTHLHQRQAVFCQHGQSRHRAGRSQIELFTPRLAGSFLGALLGELHTGKAQLAARRISETPTRLPVGSIRVSSNSGLKIFVTMPGKPAPAPTSTIFPATSGREAKSRLSRKCLSSMPSGSVMAVRLTFWLYSTRISAKASNWSSWVPVSAMFHVEHFLFQPAFIDHKLILISQKLIAIFKNSMKQTGILLSLAPVARASSLAVWLGFFKLVLALVAREMFFFRSNGFALRAGQR